MKKPTGMNLKGHYLDTLTKDFLIEKHHVEQMNPYAIGKLVGCDRATVITYMHYFEVPRLDKPRRKVYKMKDHYAWQGYGDISLTQYKNIKANADAREIPFEVTIQELWEQYLTQNEKCALSGRQIGFVHSKRGNASLDRKDSCKGYVVGNIWWLHRDVNMAKQSLSIADFISLCTDVAGHSSGS